MQSQKTSWGPNLNDFKITAKAKAVHTQQPKVADMFDEFSNAIEAMAEGLDNNSPDEDTAFVDAPPQEAIDIEEVPSGVPRKMEAGDLRTLTKAIMVASKCTLESNTIPNDLPDHIVQSIKRHDSWYMAIVDQVFDTVLKYTTRPKAQSPFSPEMSRWLKDNSDLNTRASLYEFLLHQAVRHYTALLTLVETIDVLLIDSLSTSGFSNIAVCIGSWEGLEDLRPPCLPRRSYEGLNRALRCNQGRPRLDGLVASLTWSPHDLELMIEIVDKHEQDVHVTSLNGIIKVDFEIIVSQLELRGVRKTKAEVVKGYRMLASNPNSGLTTCKTVRWRRIWDQVYRVKRHLEEEGLVLPPQDYTDPFFHVPALENGHDTSWHFKTLLKKSGYTDFDHPIMDVQGGFWATYLPRLLRREVWERITETAPERIIVGHQAMPKRLFNRALMVVLHFTQRRCTVTSDTVIVPRFEWSDLIEIWHQAFAQLIADGVPRSEILVGGACQIARLLNAHRRRLRDPSYSSTLPPWKYDDSKKASEKPAKLQPRFVDEQSLEGHDESHNIDISEETDGIYHWPSEQDRYEAVGATHQMVALAAKHRLREPTETIKLNTRRSGPCTMAQHTPSTLRILAMIMAGHHRSVFDKYSESYAGDDTFWEIIFVELGKKWNIETQAQLQHRFGWVLKYLRSGELPEEAKTASQILQECLSNSVLSSEKHPYNYDVKTWTGDLLNPDLSSNWVKKLLVFNGVWDTLKDCVQERMGGLRHRGILLHGHRYPALEQIRHGETMASSKDSETSEALDVHNTTLSESSGPSSRTSASQSKSLSSTLPLSTVPGAVRHKATTSPRGVGPARVNDRRSLAPETSVPSSSSLTLQSTDLSPSLSPPPSPPPYPPSQEFLTNKKRWQPDEDDYVKYLMRLPISRDEQLEKLHQRFQSNHRSKAALAKRIERLRNDPGKSITDKPQLERNKRYEAAEEEYLRQLIETHPCSSWDEVVAKMEQRFSKGRSKAAYQLHAAKLGLNTSRISNVWTAEHDECLRNFIRNETPPKRYSDLITEKFGTYRSRAACHRRLTELGFVGGYGTWTEEETKFIEENRDLKPRELCEKFWARFGHGRSSDSIKNKRVGVLNSKGLQWTADQLRFFSEWPHSSTTVVEAYRERFKEDTRTDSKIIKMYRKMKGRRAQMNLEEQDLEEEDEEDPDDDHSTCM
ncbi:hypothetical protein Focb16_v006886 [Fusarium oxysporum f. sp. cubense]|uniref:Myb-like domain-containing protein n=1 Tax=Fusarium oxysporum f. sp. cubense TaxID=61366 RepID=A0A559LQ22_FUSOC|nr:hypothetical protein Focb16_v006886 [Fusarium oxysporum f. sp. cubense]